ncbi:MAG: hypothetical protein CL770_04420 [Chloroflexi bacterium]|nr:hypothetical protein [Chloroflexota bacterium]|tara:strand:- start:2932 stop:4041 length:1110 start_codon:yes stop_codon:yes gene_type:complete
MINKKIDCKHNINSKLFCTLCESARLGTECLSCQFINIKNAKFCYNCGAQLGTECPSCQFINIKNAKFCTNCGIPIIPVPKNTTKSSKVFRPENNQVEITKINLKNQKSLQDFLETNFTLENVIIILTNISTNINPFSAHQNYLKKSQNKYFELKKTILKTHAPILISLRLRSDMPEISKDINLKNSINDLKNLMKYLDELADILEKQLNNREIGPLINHLSMQEIRAIEKDTPDLNINLHENSKILINENEHIQLGKDLIQFAKNLSFSTYALSRMCINQSLEKIWKESNVFSHKEAILKLHQKIMPENPSNIKNAKTLLSFFDIPLIDTKDKMQYIQDFIKNESKTIDLSKRIIWNYEQRNSNIESL